jgi:cytochrome b subunit of formate dehydrogenase
MVSFLLILVSSWLLYITSIVIYNLYFHPLSKVPGPRLWIIIPILRQIAGVRGLLDIRMREFHEYYGDVVR